MKQYLTIVPVLCLFLAVGCIGGSSKSEDIDADIIKFEITTTGAGQLNAIFNISFKQNDTFEQYDNATIRIKVTMTVTEGASTTVTYTICDFEISKDEMEEDASLANHTTISEGIYTYDSGQLLGGDTGVTLDSSGDYEATITITCEDETWEELLSLDYSSTKIS